MTKNVTGGHLVGESHAFLNMLDHISRLAVLNKPVLIIGERGTGKELVAERLHFLSQRWNESFIKLNCAAVNDNLLDSELFGHEAGSFTGASKKHLGKFERANAGSLFLDELANTSALVQEKILRVIEYGELERVGGSKTITTDVRIIAATNENLPLLAEQGRFRADLLDRLAFDVVNIPPLRARPSDILALAEHFAIEMASTLGFDLFTGFSLNAQQALLNYAWPGNIRELKNVVERSIHRANKPDQLIDQIVFDPFAVSYEFKSLTPTPTSTKHQESGAVIDKAASVQPFKNTLSWPINFKQVCQTREIELIQEALKKAKYNQKQAAKILNLSYPQLRGYLKKYSIKST